jgi:hypothetical protein
MLFHVFMPNRTAEGIDDVNIFIHAHNERTGETFAASQLLFSKREVSDPAPPLKIDITELGSSWSENKDLIQAIVDAAYYFGIKPKQLNDKNESSAQEKHLDDMRAIVFKQLHMDRPVKA